MRVRGTLLAAWGVAIWAIVLVAAGRAPVARAGGDSIEDDDTYPLDAMPRVLPVHEPLPCHDIELVRYRGEHIHYARPVRVHPAFRERLKAFEAVVVEVATDHYGRPPRRIVHLGTHNCRRMRLYPEWMSEHALGNAVDVAGFDFGWFPRDAEPPDDLPRALRRPFRVRVASHWNGRGARDAHHRHFLRDLARTLIARRDIFRTLLGPAFPGHHNHFHFDCAPYRVVDVFEAEEASTRPRDALGRVGP